jgi:hypothetical protein
MHRLPSHSAIRRIRLAALLLCAKCMLAPLSCGVLLYALIIYDKGLILIGIYLISLTVLVALLQWLVAARTACPLCMTPVLASKGCTKHRDARSFLGSHRLRVSLAVIFTNSFRCPYCHEPTILELRDRNRHFENYRS